MLAAVLNTNQENDQWRFSTDNTVVIKNIPFKLRAGRFNLSAV